MADFVPARGSPGFGHSPDEASRQLATKSFNIVLIDLKLPQAEEGEASFAHRAEDESHCSANSHDRVS